jgi:hypothetical protein
MTGELEACGDAIRALAAEEDDAVRSTWHDVKLRAIGGTDRDKKLLAMRHLDESDYEDEALLAALLESLARDEERVALTFGVTAAMNVDPSQHDRFTRLLFDEMRAARAAWTVARRSLCHDDSAGIRAPSSSRSTAMVDGRVGGDRHGGCRPGIFRGAERSLCG